MKAKVVEETIKHDDEYINSLIANLEKDLKEYIRQDSEIKKKVQRLFSLSRIHKIVMILLVCFKINGL